MALLKTTPHRVLAIVCAGVVSANLDLCIVNIALIGRERAKAAAAS